MIVIGRRHFTLDRNMDLAHNKFSQRNIARGKNGVIYITRFGRLICMTLPKPRKVRVPWTSRIPFKAY